MSESHNDWRVVHGGADLLIEGPGHLKLFLRSFSPAKIEHDAGTSAPGTERVASCAWRYPMASNWWLKLLRSSAPGEQTYHLQLGDDVIWDVPTDFAEHLQAAHELVRE